MDRTTRLPQRVHFYSNIREETISKDDHNFALEVWEKFEINNLTEYAELYCAIDTLLLAEVFQKFRSSMMKFSGLDPGHYVSLPGFGWDSMLKLTKCCLELPTDIDMVHFIERGVRGGLSFINTRYDKVDQSAGDKNTIKYIDANVRFFLLLNNKFLHC
jgi:hypothetical protein